MFKGSITALVTPFRDGAVDDKTFQAFVDWQIGEGTHGLVPCGTTGESPTLSHAEHRRVVALCVEAAGGRVPVIAGCGSNATEEALSLMDHAAKAGADAALVVTPYYNKPNQEGLYQHFAALAAASDLPIVIYNIPGRTAVDMTVETMARLAELDTIVGVKDATADLARVPAQRQAAGSDFCQLSGEDATALGFNAMGGVGCISVTSNVAPRLCAEFQQTCLAGDYDKALAYQDRLLPLHSAMFIEPSPAPVKYAANLLGICAPDVRPPLAGLSETGQGLVAAAVARVGLGPVELAA